MDRESLQTTAILVITILLILWICGMIYPPKNGKITIFNMPTNKEGLNPGFNPRFDRTFTQSAYDRQLDYMKDQRGMTSDDYSLGDLIHQNHSASLVPR